MAYAACTSDSTVARPPGTVHQQSSGARSERSATRWPRLLLHFHKRRALHVRHPVGRHAGSNAPSVFEERPTCSPPATRLPGSVKTARKYMTSATAVVSVNMPTCVTPCTLPSSHGNAWCRKRQAASRGCARLSTSDSAHRHEDDGPVDEREEEEHHRHGEVDTPLGRHSPRVPAAGEEAAAAPVGAV